jgi:DNA-binding MarR family transcriptional regulator
MSGSVEDSSGRRPLESLIGSNVGRLIMGSNPVLRAFADEGSVPAHGLRALIFVVTAEMAGKELKAGDLCRQLAISQAATSGVIARLSDTGHLVRDVDLADRRKAVLRCTDRGLSLIRAFIDVTEQYVRQSLAELPDADLEAAHRVLSALAGGAELPGGLLPSLGDV